MVVYIWGLWKAIKLLEVGVGEQVCYGSYLMRARCLPECHSSMLPVVLSHRLDCWIRERTWLEAGREEYEPLDLQEHEIVMRWQTRGISARSRNDEEDHNSHVSVKLLPLYEIHRDNCTWFETQIVSAHSKTTITETNDQLQCQQLTGPGPRRYHCGENRRTRKYQRCGKGLMNDQFTQVAMMRVMRERARVPC